MSIRQLALAGVLAAVCGRAAAAEHWVAASTTAMAITGDVSFSPEQIRFANGTVFYLQPAGRQKAFLDGTDKVDAAIYQVVPPADPKLKAGNRLCGGAKAQLARFIAVWQPEAIGADKAPRSMAVFSGMTAPAGDGGTDLCGIFNYEAG